MKKHKPMKVLTYRKCVIRARRFVRILKNTKPDAPNWEALVAHAKYWKALALEKATTNSEVSEASLI